MKNIVLKLVVLMFVGLGVLTPLSAASVSLLSPSISPAPLDRVENNGEGIVSFGLVETSDVAAPAKDLFGEENLKVSVELNKLKLKDDDVSLITGEFMDYFSASYNANDKRITFIQIADFPGFGFADVKIPVVVTGNALATDNSLNGFNANISANAASTLAGGNAAEFTYTKLLIPDAPEITRMANNPADTVLTNDNTPSISGTCLAGYIVTLHVDAVAILPEVECQSNGTFTMTPSTMIPEGNHAMTATQKSDNSDTSSISPVDNLMVDTIAPAAPEVVITEDANNDGKISEKSELNGKVDVEIFVSKDAQVGDTLLITNIDGTNTTVVVTQEIIDNGYAIAYDVPANGKTMNVSATLTDGAKNTSSRGKDTARIVNDLAPASPVITSMDNNQSDTVATANNKARIKGTCIPSNIVTVQVDNMDISPTTVCQPNGTFSLIPREAIEDGEHALIATQVGTNGIESEESPIDHLIVDTVAPRRPSVVITEDSDNDTYISAHDELNDKVDVKITLTSDVNVGEVLTIVGADGQKTVIIVTNEILDNGYYLAYPAEYTKEYKVSATVTDKVGNISPLASDTATLVNDSIPDYIPTINANGTIINGNSGELDIVVRVGEFANGTNFKGDVRFTIVKNTNLVLNFAEDETSRQDDEVQNPDWEFMETATLYVFTYVGNNGQFRANTASRVGLSGTFTAPRNSKGKFALDVTVTNGSAEINVGNNKDTEILEYNNLSN